MSHSIPDTISFTHVVLEGTPYEVGRRQADILKHDPARAQYLTPHLPFLDAFSPREAQRALDYIETYCPGLRDEVQGAADGFGVPVEEIAFLGGKSKKDGSSPVPVGGAHCSQFAVLPSATEDGHLYAAQNTDGGLADMDLRLCTTRVAGKPAHIGFSDMIFGRSGGINEHGLCVNTSWGAPMMWPPCSGLPYFAMVRALLDRCRDVDHALRTLEGIPVAWCTNVLVSDRSGQAALIEVAGEERAVTRIGPDASDPFLCATNHYTAPQLQAYSAHRRRESVTRRQTIAARLGAALPRVSVETMRDLVAEPFPGGLCLHHYADGMGTLWSTIYDVTEATVDVCFGAPSSDRNPWRAFGLRDPAGVTRYEAHLPNEPAAPGFWERVPAVG